MENNGRWQQKTYECYLKKEVLDWIHDHIANMLCVSRQLIMQKVIHNEAIHGDLCLQGGFMVSRGCFEKFMKGNRLSLRRRRTVEKKSKRYGRQAGDVCCPNSKITIEI